MYQLKSLRQRTQLFEIDFLALSSIELKNIIAMSSLIYCKSVYILLPNDVINVGILYKVHDVKQNLTAIVMGQEITMLESIIQNPMQNYNRKGRTISTVA